MDELNLKDFLPYLKDRDLTSISHLQRDFSFGFNKARFLYESLIKENFINEKGEINKKKVYEALGENRKTVKIIFLDVDGVLNCTSTPDKINTFTGIEDKKVLLLKKIVKKSKALIVLISTWKLNWYVTPSRKSEQDELANYLDEKLAKAGLRALGKINDDWVDRGEGILDYISRLEKKKIHVDNFIILDDGRFDYKASHLTPNLIQTSPKTGLTEKHVKRAVEHLSKPD